MILGVCCVYLWAARPRILRLCMLHIREPELCSSRTAPAATVPGVTACGSGTLPRNTCDARILECPGLQETVEYWQRYGVACTSVCEAKTISMHACPRLRFER